MLHKRLDRFYHRTTESPKVYTSTAFTIIELVVVISIIAILAGIVIVSYGSWRQSTTVSVLKSDLNGAAAVMENYRNFNSGYPASIPSTFSPSSGVSLSLVSSDIVKGFCITATSGSVTYRVTNDLQPAVGSCSRTSCLDILNSGESAGDNWYWVKPSSIGYRVYCNMSDGGWTRLNNDVSTSTTPFGTDDVLSTNNVPGNCGTPGCAFTINGIAISHTNIRVIFTRTTSVVQCPSIVGAGSGSAYLNGSNWVASGNCLWSDAIWANATSTDMTGLKKTWKIEGAKASNSVIQFVSQCSGGDDNGLIQVTAWVE